MYVCRVADMADVRTCQLVSSFLFLRGRGCRNIWPQNALVAPNRTCVATVARRRLVAELEISGFAFRPAVS